MKIITQHGLAVGRAIFVIRRPNQQRSDPRRGRPAEHGCLITLHRIVQSRRFKQLKTFLRIVVIHGQFASLAAGNDQVISSVAVQIEPRDARAELTQTIGQEWLTREVVEQFFMMFVSQPFADIFKHRLRFGVGSWQLEVGSFFGAWSLELGVCRFRPRLSDFVKVIRLAIVYDAPRAAAPGHLDGEAGRAAGGKDPHRIIAGQVTTATDDFLALCHRPAINFDFCSDAL